MPSQNVKPDQPNLFQRIWYSIFPHTYREKDERRPYRSWLNTLLLHFRPKVVQERTLRITLTWGLGGMAVVSVGLLFAFVVVPLIIAGVLLLMPYLPYDENTAGVWFASYRGRRMAIVAAVVAIVSAPLFVLADDLFFDFAAWMPGIPPVVSSGLLPAAITLAALGGFYALMKKKYTATKNEAVQAVFVLLLLPSLF